MNEEITCLERMRKVYTGQRLTHLGEQMYWNIVDGLNHMKVQIPFDFFCYDEMVDIVLAVVTDYPELSFFWDYHATLKNANSKWNERYHEMTLVYRYTKDVIKMKLKQMEYGVESVIHQAGLNECLTDKERIVKIYEYMTKNWKYTSDEMKLSNGEYPYQSYSLETLVNKQGVCMGLSLTFLYIMKKLQIQTLYIRGKVGNEQEEDRSSHAWNMVILEDTNEVYHLDLTWDLERNKSQYQYLFLSDKEMIEKERKWIYKNYPATKKQ